jgi:hypothetical protein
VIQDGDLEYDPADLLVMRDLLASGRAEIVYGSRNLRPNKEASRLFYWGGRFVTLVTNVLFGTSLTDEPTCYKMFPTDVIRSFGLTCDGFDFCPEVTGKALRRGHRITEIPIGYAPRSIAEGKKIRWRDGVRAVWVLVKCRFAPTDQLVPAGEERRREVV